MTMPRIEVITTVERRRRWSRADKERLVAASLAPGANVSAVARQAGVHTSQLFRWRRQLCTRSEPAPVFAAVAISPEPAHCAIPDPAGWIEIEFAGARVKIPGAADPVIVSAVLSTLAGARR
jgi:transposase